MKRSRSNGRTSVSGASLAWPKISLRWGLAAIVAVLSGPIVPMYTPSWTASNSRAKAAARRSTGGLYRGRGLGTGELGDCDWGLFEVPTSLCPHVPYGELFG